MEDRKKLELARSYMEQLANGVDPITGVPAPDEDIINNVRLSRCFFYVADVLRQVIENEGAAGRAKREKKPKKQPFSITHEELRGFPLSDTPIPVSEITKRVNALKEGENMVKLSHRSVNAFFVEAGMLRETTDAAGKSVKRPTDFGETMGVRLEERTGQYGTYTVVLYTREAQQFILDNMDGIVMLQNRSKEAK